MKLKFNCESYLAIVTVVLLFISCKNDTFWDTKRYIKTNKTEYQIGDTIELTISIETIDREKLIRIYENYKNVSISFALVNNELNVLNDQWSQSSEETLPKSKIQEIKITPDSALTKTFLGSIVEEQDSVKINFDELNLNVKYSKERLKRDKLRIHGFCRPISPNWADPLEDYMEIKDIKINVKNQ